MPFEWLVQTTQRHTCMLANDRVDLVGVPLNLRRIRSNYRKHQVASSISCFKNPFHSTTECYDGPQLVTAEIASQ